MRHIALALAVLTVALPAAARTYKLGGVEVTDPWTRPAAAGQTAVGYMALKNTGKTSIVLIGAQTPVAAKAGLHRTSMSGGVMRMAAVTGGLTVAPGATATLAPAGYHLMLEGLTKPLVLGQRTPLTLVFADGRKVQVELSVQTTAGASAAGAGVDPMQGMKH